MDEQTAEEINSQLQAARKPVFTHGDDIVGDEKYSPDLTVYQVAWNADHPREGDEPTVATIYCRVFLGDKELPAIGVNVRASGNDFTEAEISISVGRIRFVQLDLDAFHAAGPPSSLDEPEGISVDG